MLGKTQIPKTKEYNHFRDFFWKVWKNN